MNREDVISLIKEELEIVVSTSSNYTGGLDGSGKLYSDSITLKLVLDGEVISEAYMP